MSTPANRPQSAGPSKKGLVTIVAIGLSLTALAAISLAVDYLRGGFSDDAENPHPADTAAAGADTAAQADFANATCEDFDLAAFKAIAAGAAEPSNAIAAANTDSGPGVLYCAYTADSGMTLSLTAVADAAEDHAERTTDQSRQIWEGDPATYAIEDFDNGDLTGYTNSYVQGSRQVFLLTAGVDRLLITVGLDAEPGAFETIDALRLAEAMAGQVLERFAAYT